jgi:2-methylisocitrate lyase-like PEP mutase family enzyme
MADVTSFLELHVPGRPLLMPNAWDAGSARILADLGFRALATTSSGFAATLGRADGQGSRDVARAHAAAVVAAVDVPVSADLENGFADDPAGVAETIRLAKQTGLAGCSVEDATSRAGEPIYDLGLATERVAAAAEAAGEGFVLTARAENYLHGRPDLDDTVRRLQAYQEAGAHVLYAPGITAEGEIRTVVGALARPMNVLALPDAPSVAELGGLGVARISVGGAFAFAALAALVEAGRELLDHGTYGYFARTRAGKAAADAAFTPRGERP